jgi:hypothetical protein
MIFRVYEHYDDNQTIYSSYDKPSECFICYELSTELEPCPISLKYQLNYNKKCKCDGWIHKRCLDIWYKKQKKCPVCRLEIQERTNSVYAVVSVIPYSNRIYLFVCKSMWKVATILAYTILIYAAIEFYLSITLNKYIDRQKQYNYNRNPYLESAFNNSELTDDFSEKKL